MGVSFAADDVRKLAFLHFVFPLFGDISCRHSVKDVVTKRCVQKKKRFLTEPCGKVWGNFGKVYI